MCLAIPGKILDIHGDEPMSRTAKVDFNGIVKSVHMGYVPEAKPGDWVNVHAGFAITILKEEDAREILDIFQEMVPKDLNES